MREKGQGHRLQRTLETPGFVCFVERSREREGNQEVLFYNGDIEWLIYENWVLSDVRASMLIGRGQLLRNFVGRGLWKSAS